MEHDLKKLDKQCRRLSESILERAVAHDLTVCTAESCTGGLIAAYLTAVPGSSAYFKGGIVSYWEELKTSLLQVDPKILETDGVVSEECAEAMARGASRVLSCDFAVTTTGIAGPTGALPGKPIGTVCYGIATPAGSYASTACKGVTRDEVRLEAVAYALELLEYAIKSQFS